MASFNQVPASQPSVSFGITPTMIPGSSLLSVAIKVNSIAYRFSGINTLLKGLTPEYNLLPSWRRSPNIVSG